MNRRVSRLLLALSVVVGVCRADFGLGAKLSEQAGPPRRAVSCRRPRGCAGTRARRPIEQDVGPAGDHRKPRRRRRQSRRGGGRTRGAGRLHAAAQCIEPCHQCEPVREAAIRPDQGLHAGFGSRFLHAGAGRAPVRSGDVGERIRRLRKSKPDGLSVANAGLGTPTHLAAVLFAQAAGVNLVHVPYRGAAPASTDLIAGQVPAMFNNPVNAVPQVRANSLRALAATGSKRLSLLPDIPTIAESGYPGFETRTWYGLFGPAGCRRTSCASCMPMWTSAAHSGSRKQPGRARMGHHGEPARAVCRGAAIGIGPLVRSGEKRRHQGELTWIS